MGQNALLPCETALVLPAGTFCILHFAFCILHLIFSLMADALVPETAAAATTVKNTDARRPRGRLTIFFGMAPGAGKTQAMLQAAHREKRAGRDVVIGALETRRWPGITALARGLPGLARDQALSAQPGPSEGRADAASGELDLDTILARQSATGRGGRVGPCQCARRAPSQTLSGCP